MVLYDAGIILNNLTLTDTGVYTVTLTSVTLTNDVTSFEASTVLIVKGMSKWGSKLFVSDNR